MSTRVSLLIDGYNLLFQTALVGRARGPGWLERARERMLRQLDAGLDPDLAARTQVVFDASQAATVDGVSATTHGIQVEFASEYPEADDMLEGIIRRHPTPKRLNVVSSDQRIRRCTRARRAISLDSETFWQQLERGQWRAPATPLTDAASGQADELLGSDEVEYWLRKFGP